MLTDAWTLLTLTLLETILSVDNLIFISLAIDKVPNALRERVRLMGLGLALLMRFVILFFTSSILSMQKPIFHTASARDLLMIAGGLFLIVKSSMELRDDIFVCKKNKKKANVKSKFFLVVLQIILIDLVFSVDSILTAIALTYNMVIIATAFTFSMLAMLFLSSYTAQLIKSNPGLKIIAILFVLLVGVYLILHGFHIELPKGYLYSSFMFALLVEIISKIKKINRHTAIHSRYLSR
ncbi:MAG: TerC family protein [Wolbachia endosymbiont of Andrena praecox]|uniref:TerC family protein n=2 Tax=Wolbachia TaxID=953 RepID=UPI0001986488|nr:MULTISPECIES: membrane protein [Wolbachia]MDX5487217.1 TerC family protein [Wolbachia endosymbiont of Andrena praecox]MDX5497497.1 TerC family protein [Wolbachia endosymbiont of Lasioglossum nitidulum]MDX5510114.1 TerC family protein [Wolbachia endosymbiont of Lasioglossum morio]MDX5542992.1 TerC family protein [Wolbachia endosymbiont of Andrena apicata]MDX5561800.1 TerC family protein [Wolbachia endosymbiont of Andrena bicolor]MDX5595924.1 TerC family protein [Wolbachia endosymbiont of An